jgi:hypothetical protein
MSKHKTKSDKDEVKINDLFAEEKYRVQVLVGEDRVLAPGKNFHPKKGNHNTEPRVLPYKPAATVHVPRNVVGLTTQKYRFPIPWIKLHLIAPKNVGRTGPSAPARQ